MPEYMLSTATNAPRSLQALAAHLQAKEYFEAGANQYRQIAALIRREPNSPGGLHSEAVALDFFSIVTAGSLLAFSIELSLKAAALQRLPKSRRGHDLRSLLEHLGADYKVEVSRKFLAEDVAPYLAFELTFQTQPPPGKRAGANSFDEAMVEVAQLFTELRYYFESFDRSHVQRVDFSDLFRIAKSAIEVNAEYKGKFSVGGTGR